MINICRVEVASVTACLLLLVLLLITQAAEGTPHMRHSLQTHLHHYKSNHSFGLNSEFAANNQSLLKFNRGFYAQHGNECKIAVEASPDHAEHFDLSLKLFLAPSVLKVTAVEKFKYFRTVLNTNRERVTRLKSYSILFQIKRILKYENTFEATSGAEFDTASSQTTNQTIVFLSSQDEYSNIINLNSFLLVENFELTQQAAANGSDKSDCHSSIEIQLNRNYILFLNAQNRQLPVDRRKHFTHPIRFDTGKASHHKQEPLTNFVSYKSESVVKIMTKMAIFIKVPIFNLFSAPIHIDGANFDSLEKQISSQSCHDCGRIL
jgi:hypothetical protein